jgi:hypothetical protein
MCRTLASRSFQRFFSFKNAFSVIFSLSLNLRLVHIFEISAKFRFFWFPLQTILKKFFLNSYKVLLFSEDKRSNKIETAQYFKNVFLWNSLFSRPNQKLIKHIKCLKKCKNHWTLKHKVLRYCGWLWNSCLWQLFLNLSMTSLRSSCILAGCLWHLASDSCWLAVKQLSTRAWPDRGLWGTASWSAAQFLSSHVG